MKKTSLLTLALVFGLGAAPAMASTTSTDAKRPDRKYLIREFFSVVAPMSDVEIEYKDIDGDGIEEAIMFHRSDRGLDAFLVLTCTNRTLHTVCADNSFPTGSYKFPAKGFVTYTVTDDRQYNGDFVYDLTDVTLCSKVENSTPLYTVRVTRQLMEGVNRASVNYDNYLASINTTCTLTIDGKDSAITVAEAMKLLPESVVAECFAPELEREMAEQVEVDYVTLYSGTVSRVPLYHSDATDLYCTDALKELLKKAETAHPEDEMGPIDYDFWYMTQDDINPSIRVESATLIDARHGEVVISLIDNGEPYNEITLKMEKGKYAGWLIDDFVTGDGDNTVSMVDLLKNYIRR